MAFTLLTGRFSPKLGNPDGDSVKFVPDDPAPLFKLRRRGSVPKLHDTNFSIQLRYEGIDCLEKQAIKPSSSDATAANLAIVAPNGEEGPGYICTDQLDPNGRPVCFAFTGKSPHPDGSKVHLSPEEVSNSVNVKQLSAGHAYPLFYDTLYADLRLHLASQAKQARLAARGIWKADATTSGFEWNGNLAEVPPIFPKLWRRIDTYRRDETFFDASQPAAGLKPYLESLKEERVLLLDDQRFTGFDDVIAVEGNTIRMLTDAENLIVISEKASSSN